MKIEPIGMLQLLLLALGLLAIATPVRASEAFPPEVQRALDMPCAPTCSLCHLDDSGGPGRRNLGVGTALLFNGGLVPGQPQTVATALAAIEAMVPPSDVDGDGVSDVTELRNGTNPNVPGEGALCGPEYGCFARVAPARPQGDSVAAVAAVLAALSLAGLARRRR